MPKFLTDENFNGRIIAGLRLSLSAQSLDLVTAREVGLEQTPDDRILVWAAAAGRAVLTHDYETMIPLAYQRLAAGGRMPGLILVPAALEIGRAVRGLVPILGGGRLEDLENQVRYVSR